MVWKRLREDAGLSQAALAEAAGMNVFGVAKIEQGLREPGWGTVLKLAAALGVECTAFFARAPAKRNRQRRARRDGEAVVDSTALASSFSRSWF